MPAFILAAARTVISPKGGIHRDTPLHELAGMALRHAWAGFGHKPERVILGNALAAGGNPARVAALWAFGDEVPGLTVDTQCCGGMDAIALAASLISSGKNQLVLAGGAESYSQAPQRSRKTAAGIQPYQQAQFSPWADRDPPVLVAAQNYADHFRISRERQEAWAIESHRKASRVDTYARDLRAQALRRFPPLIRPGAYAITAATVAPEADGAAALVIGDETAATGVACSDIRPIEILDFESTAGDPSQPASAGLDAAKQLLARLPRRLHDKIHAVEIMESFAAQALHHQQALGFPAQMVNARGGLLAAGHPIGASGAVLVGNLFWELQSKPKGSLGLACIPAAGGLGSAILVGS